MRPISPKGGSGRLFRAAVLGLGLFLAAVYFGCGRMPPEPWWEPTAEDTAGIAEAVQAQAAVFTTSFDEMTMLSMNTVMPGSTEQRLEAEIRENPYKLRFQCDSFQHVFFADSYELKHRFVATLDTLRAETTATVTIGETIPGVIRMHAYAYTRYVAVDTFTPSPGETLFLTRYDTLFTDTSMYVEKPLSASTVDGCVLRKESGEWVLWKYGGGSRLYAPTYEDAPYIPDMVLTGPDTALQINLRPDTLNYGIQRFYLPEQLPTFSIGDTVAITSYRTTVLDARNYSYLDEDRHEFSASDRVPVVNAGIQRLYFVSIPIEVFYEYTGDYVATAWGISIRAVE